MFQFLLLRRKHAHEPLAALGFGGLCPTLVAVAAVKLLPSGAERRQHIDFSFTLTRTLGINGLRYFL